jgi:hypothetical protein
VEDGWIIELEADRRFVHWDWAWTSLAVGRCSLLGRVQTGLKGGGIQYSDLTGDSSLARAFESKHGHLQLRGSSRSSIEEPGQKTSIGTYIDY